MVWWKICFVVVKVLIYLLILNLINILIKWKVRRLYELILEYDYKFRNKI